VNVGVVKVVLIVFAVAVVLGLVAYFMSLYYGSSPSALALILGKAYYSNGVLNVSLLFKNTGSSSVFIHGFRVLHTDFVVWFNTSLDPEECGWFNFTVNSPPIEVLGIEVMTSGGMFPIQLNVVTSEGYTYTPPLVTTTWTGSLTKTLTNTVTVTSTETATTTSIATVSSTVTTTSVSTTTEATTITIPLRTTTTSYLITSTTLTTTIVSGSLTRTTVTTVTSTVTSTFTSTSVVATTTTTVSKQIWKEPITYTIALIALIAGVLIGRVARK